MTENEILTAFKENINTDAPEAHIEATLQHNVFRIYTELWQITGDELRKLSYTFDIHNITVDGGTLTFNVSPK